MAASRNKRQIESEQRKIDKLKTELMELAGDHVIEAFNRVRLIHDSQAHQDWQNAYIIVISEIKQQQKDEG